MRAHGYEKPVVVGEYRGPTPFWFPGAMAVISETMMSAFAGATEAPADLSTDELRAQAGQETPERRAMRALYARPDVPPELAMFLADCPPGLEARRRRMGCRDLVMRNLLALSAGVRRTICWDLAPEVPGRVDHLTMAHLMYATLPLLDYEGTKLNVRHPEAETFALLAKLLAGALTVTRRPLPDRPEVAAFDVDRGAGGPLLAVWDEQRDLFDGEELPAQLVEVPWPSLEGSAGTQVEAVDAFGAAVAVERRPGSVVVPVSVTPVLVYPASPVSPVVAGSSRRRRDPGTRTSETELEPRTTNEGVTTRKWSRPTWCGRVARLPRSPSRPAARPRLLVSRALVSRAFRPLTGKVSFEDEMFVSRSPASPEDYPYAWQSGQPQPIGNIANLW
ncbi:hypothetical protein ABZV93_12935 [Actinopolymorpha sp. NPDC004070]|uniref:hypothetical protein n=1 Tax=Actinopolymorpha sp. NPDC004070 TaxID=3154548 RepID=UPI0033B90D11